MVGRALLTLGRQVRVAGLAVMAALWANGAGAHGPCPEGLIPEAAIGQERGEVVPRFDDAEPSIDDAVVRELLVWIGAHSDYDISSALRDPPRLRFCDTGEVLDYEGHEIVVDAAMRAAYDLQERMIYLVRPWDAAKIEHRASLLHELIHDLQFAQRRWRCSVEPEWEAYKLQDAWLREQGVESGFSWLKIQMLSTCPQGIHP